MIHLRRVVVGLFFLCLLVLALHKVIGYDIWWQIKTGEWILEHGFPTLDPFSYAFPAREWIEPRWLFCVLVHLVFAKLGLNFVILAKVAFLLAAFGLLLRVEGGPAGWTTVAGMTLALLAAHLRLMVRPELFTYVALTLTLLCLTRYQQGGKTGWILGLPLLQVLWSNTHTLWILGPVVQWIVVGGEWLETRLAPVLLGGMRRDDRLAGRRLAALAAVAGASSLAALVNPYFVRGALFPFRLFRQIGRGHYVSDAITELQSPLSPDLLGWNYGSFVYFVVVGVSLLAFLLNGRRLALSRAALWIAFLFLSLQAQRNLVFFGFVAAWATILNLAEYSRRHEGQPHLRRVSGAVWAAVAVYLSLMVPLVATDHFYRWIGSARRFGFGISSHRYPVRALAFVREGGLPRPVLHGLGDGGFVLFEGGERSAYVDGRLEVYDAGILRRARSLTRSGDDLSAETERLGVRTVLVRNDPGYAGLLRTLESSPEWQPVYFDDLHQVYVRVTPETLGHVERFGLDWSRPVERPVRIPAELSPRDWLAGLWPKAGDPLRHDRLGSFFASVGNYPEALEQFEAAARLAPRDPRVCLFLGLFRRAQGRDAEAAKLLARAPSGAFAQPELNRLAGELHLWAERPDAALDYFRRAAALGAPEPFVSEGVARAATVAGRLALAESTLSRLVVDHPDRYRTWNLFAVLAVRQNRPALAIERFERSLSLQPAQPRVYEALASLYTQTGDDAKAQKMRRRGAAARP